MNGESGANGGAGGEATGAEGQTNLDGQTTGESPEELESRAKELQATPGYIDGTLKNSNPEKYKLLTQQITNLYERSGQSEVPTLAAASEASVRQAEAATDLMNRANAEFGALKALGFEGRLPTDIQEYHVEAWQNQRLLAGGNYAELQPLLEQGLRDIESPPQHVQALSMFLGEDDFDPELRESITELIVAFVYNRKHAAAKAKGSL